MKIWHISSATHALTAYFLMGKFWSFFVCLSVFKDFSCWFDPNFKQLFDEERIKTHLGQPSSDSTSPLGSEVKGKVLLVLIVFPEILASLLVDDRQYPCDRLANGVAVRVGSQLAERNHIIDSRTFL